MEKVKQERKALLQKFRASPVFEDEIMQNLGLYLRRGIIEKILFLNEIVEQISNIPGDIAEIGVRWGQNLSFFSSLRDIHDPFNINRRILGFDTFCGFISNSIEDRTSTNADLIQPSSFSVPEGYENHLNDILNYHQCEGFFWSYEAIRNYKRRRS